VTDREHAEKKDKWGGNTGDFMVSEEVRVN